MQAGCASPDGYIIDAAKGEWEQGVAACRRAVERSRDVLYRALSAGFLGFAYREQGDAERAIASLEQAIPLLDRFGLRAFEGWFTAFLAESYRLTGRLERAEVLAEDARRISTGAGFDLAVGWAQQALGRIALARGDLTTAAARLEEALVTFGATHSRYERGRTHVDLAATASARADVEAARRHLAEAGQMFVELDVPRHRERVERLAAAWGLSST